MSSRRIIVVGGGAAGVFAAIACAEAMPEAEVTVLEKGPEFLTKVRISGGGRCNVTHACFGPRELAARYPRGGRALIGPFKRFQPRDTVAWFEARGVKLKTERDGRMFPVTDDSQTVVDCLVRAAKAAGVKLRARCGVEKISIVGETVAAVCDRRNRAAERVSVPQSIGSLTASATAGAHRAQDRFELTLSNGERLVCDRLLLATGGCRTAAAGELAVSPGHTLEPPVPSLFTFHIETAWLRELAGISVEPVEASVPGTKLRERGALLATHWGLSGPAILRLSAWGARELHGLDYKFPLRVNWLPQLSAEAVVAKLRSRRDPQPARFVANTPIAPLPARLWERLVIAAGIGRETRWAALTRAAQHRLVQQLIRTEFPVTGKSMNKDEFVTCGGVRLGGVDFKTMESRLCPGLYFAGELLDVDGITGGFNFQAAWTTGWIAGRAMAGVAWASSP